MEIDQFEDLKEDQKEFVQNHNYCLLCGTKLNLLHIRLLEDGQVKEEAHCPQCEIRTRAKKYTLH